MSFHKKVLIGFVLFNVISITLILLNSEPPPDRATSTDPDMIAYGVAKPLATALILSASSFVVILVYGVRGLFKLAQRLCKKMT